MLTLLSLSSISDVFHSKGEITAMTLQKHLAMADGTEMSRTGMSVRQFAVTYWPVVPVKMALQACPTFLVGFVQALRHQRGLLDLRDVIHLQQDT